MANGYNNAGEHDFADLDEWLCEYVDGTIDPVVCKALEEYMQHNPELAAHIEQLRETRHLLCQYGCSYQAPSGLQPRLRRRLATEIIQESQPFLGTSTVHLMTLATLTSVVALILIFAASNKTTKDTPPAIAVEQQALEGKAVAQKKMPEKENMPVKKNILAQENMLPQQRLITANRRATPFINLLSNKYYSQFTHQPAVFSPAYSSPGLFPINAYMRPATVALPALSEDLYNTP